MLSEQYSQEFIIFLKRYNDFYQDFVTLENGKFNAMTADDITLIDDFVKKEQAFLLKSRGFERERDCYMDKAKHSELTLREFIPLLDTNFQEKAKELFENLTTSLYALKDINKRCNNLAEIRLHKVSKILNQNQNYTATTVPSKGSISTISKKI
ncbi:MAG: flagellar export chaperone FlgN [Oscillospiraceae bacterium]